LADVTKLYLYQYITISSTQASIRSPATDALSVSRLLAHPFDLSIGRPGYRYDELDIDKPSRPIDPSARLSIGRVAPWPGRSGYR